MTRRLLHRATPKPKPKPKPNTERESGHASLGDATTAGPAIKTCDVLRVMTEKCDATSRAAGNPATAPTAAETTGAVAMASAMDRKRAVAGEDASGGANAGAIDNRTRRLAELAHGLIEGETHRPGVTDIRSNGDAANFCGHGLGTPAVEIDNRDSGAKPGQMARGRLPQPASATCDQRGISHDIHLATLR